MATIDEIKQQAEAVKNATQVGENTAERVGGALAGLADIAEQQDSKLSDLSSIIKNTGFKFKIAFINVNTGEELENTTRFISDFVEISNKPFVIAFDENNNIIGVSYFYYTQNKIYLGTNYTPSSKYVRFSINKDKPLSYELISKYHIFFNNQLVHNFTEYGLVSSAGIKHDGFYTLDNTETIEQ